MPAWDIQPSGVRAVLGRTAREAAGFARHAEQAAGAMRSAATNTSSALVAGALSGYLAALGEDVTAVQARTRAVLTGAAQATGAYLAGDAQMAATAQAAAGAAPTPAMPGAGGPR